jgi:hypothetical protein
MAQRLTGRGRRDRGGRLEGGDPRHAVKYGGGQRGGGDGPDPAGLALGRVAEALAAPLVTGDELSARGGELHVRAVELDFTAAATARMFGFDVEVVLVVTDTGRSNPGGTAGLCTDIVRASLTATDVGGAHGVPAPHRFAPLHMPR